NEDVAYWAEDDTGTVMVVRQPAGLNMIVGGSVGAGTLRRFQESDEFVAYMPLLLHRNPEDVAVVCFGTGRTSGLIARYPTVKRVEVAEVVGSTVTAGRTIFPDFNQSVLTNPKVTISIDDGFNFVKYNPKRFDVISVDPFTPRDPGSARLYTRD